MVSVDYHKFGNKYYKKMSLAAVFVFSVTIPQKVRSRIPCLFCTKFRSSFNFDGFWFKIMLVTEVTDCYFSTEICLLFKIS